VTVRGEWIAPDGEAGWLRLEVEDTGIGIARENVQELFQPFVQLGVAEQEQQGGTGLGLSICKAIVEAMGGRVHAESRLGEGTRFVVELPLPRVGQDTTGAAEAGRQSGMGRPESNAETGKLVLVAEDNMVNQRIIVKMLEALGHSVEVASNGRQAVDAARSVPYDAILMDYRMPEMDGLEATRAIRENGACARTPIIGLSANVFESDREAGRQAGMDGFLGKPLHLDDLRRCLDRLNGGAEGD